MAPSPTGARSRQRTRARELAMQALYQRQVTAHSARELIAQFAESREYARADSGYFRELLLGVEGDSKALEALIAEYADRPVEQLDLVEHAILLVGAYELKHRSDIPYRVVLNEAVELAHRFGAEEGHKFVNAVLDRAARALRER